MKTAKYAAIVAASVIIPIVVLYLMFAFILWNMQWAFECTMLVRFLFVILMIMAIITSITSGCCIINELENKIK